MPNRASTPSPGPLHSSPRSITWIGGVVRPYGMQGLRVAAWITRGGSLVGAAIVDGHGPSVLGELLDEQLQRAPAERRPDRIVVWPADRAAVRGLQFPPVTLEREGFLKVVIEDLADAGQIPGRLPVRRAACSKSTSAGGRRAGS